MNQAVKGWKLWLDFQQYTSTSPKLTKSVIVQSSSGKAKPSKQLKVLTSLSALKVMPLHGKLVYDPA